MKFSVILVLLVASALGLEIQKSFTHRATSSHWDLNIEKNTTQKPVMEEDFYDDEDNEDDGFYDPDLVPSVEITPRVNTTYLIPIDGIDHQGKTGVTKLRFVLVSLFFVAVFILGIAALLKFTNIWRRIKKMCQRSPPPEPSVSFHRLV